MSYYTALIQIRLGKKSGLIWVQTDCKGYPQTQFNAQGHRVNL